MRDEKLPLDLFIVMLRRHCGRLAVPKPNFYTLKRARGRARGTEYVLYFVSIVFLPLSCCVVVLVQVTKFARRHMAIPPSRRQPLGHLDSTKNSTCTTWRAGPGRDGDQAAACPRGWGLVVWHPCTACSSRVQLPAVREGRDSALGK
jgi:hypothetical protein